MPHVRQYRTPDDYILRDILPECRELGSLARERLLAGLADMNGQVSACRPRPSDAARTSRQSTPTLSAR